eukprot:5583052-Prymnesium_polylepis.1
MEHVPPNEHLGHRGVCARRGDRLEGADHGVLPGEGVPAQVGAGELQLEEEEAAGAAALGVAGWEPHHATDAAPVDAVFPHGVGPEDLRLLGLWPGVRRRSSMRRWGRRWRMARGKPMADSRSPERGMKRRPVRVK